MTITGGRRGGRPLRIGIWCAVSSQAQAADDKISLDEQERAGREFCAAVEGELTATYIVPGHSRDLIFWQDAEAVMPAYRQLREDVEEGRLDVLWAADLDRLGRDPALINQVLSLVEKGGGEVYSASTPHPLGAKSVGFRYISAIQAVRAGEDQAQRVARHRMGMKGRIVKRGLMPTTPPTGYRSLRDTAGGEVTGYEFGDEIGAVEQLTTLFLDGISYEQIARIMDEGDWSPPGRGQRWHPTTIYRILHNDTYAGLPGWADYAAEGPSAAYPALWDPPTFAAVLRERGRRKTGPYTRRGGGPYTGVAFCLRCEARMIRVNRRYKDRVYHYLRCGRHSRRRDLCHPNYLPEHRITAEISAFVDWLGTEENLRAALAAWGTGQEAGILRASLDRARGASVSIQAQRDRLGLALAAGKMDFDLYRRLDDDLLRRLESERARESALERQLEALPDLDERCQILGRLAEAFPELVARSEPGALATLLQNAGLTVWCEEGDVVEVRLG